MINTTTTMEPFNQRKNRRPRRVVFLLLSSFLVLRKEIRVVDSFGPTNVPIISNTKRARFISTSRRTNGDNNDATHLSAMPSSHSTATITVPTFLGSAAAPLGVGSIAVSSADDFPIMGLSSLVSTMTSSESTNAAVVEGEIFTGLAHLTLDLFTFFGPATIITRSAAIIGRLCAMAADYIPDHLIVPEELAFQSFMLMVAWIGLVKAMMPLAFATFASNISFRDGKAFSVLFRPAGLSWSQFKALSVCAFDWITVQPGDIITTDEKHNHNNKNDQKQQKEDEYIYWLYSGDVEVQSNGKTVLEVVRKDSGASMKKFAGRGLLGEVRLLRRMEDRRKKGNNNNKKYNKTGSSARLENGVADNKESKNDSSSSSSPFAYPRTTIKAGSSGAQLLRIHTPNLTMLMDSDPQLADSIRTLLFQGMQAKLSAQMMESSAL